MVMNGKTRKLLYLCALFLALPAAIITAQSFGIGDPVQPSVGEIVYIEGFVDVKRGGELLDWTTVDIGTQIERYDLIETGDDGIAEIALESPGNRGMKIFVKPDTAFYFDDKMSGSKQQTKISMLAGTLSLKVQKLGGKNEVVVQTPSVAMGVRGTEFDVTAAPDGSFLVTCEEGSVECTADDGTGLYAQPGTVVEKTEDSFKRVNVSVSDLENYRQFWFSQREEVFRAGAPVFMRFYALQFIEFLPKYRDAYRDLAKHQATFIKWAKLYKEGITPALGEVMEVRREVSREIFAMRRIYLYFEHVFFRLKVFEKYHNQGIGRSQFADNYSSADFFRTYGNVREDLVRQMAQVRFYFGVYARMSDPFGDDELMEDLFSGGNPLEGSGPPKPSIGNF